MKTTIIKTLLPLIAVVSGSFYSQAQSQCNNTLIAPVYIRISDDQTIAAAGTGYWVCEGVHLTVTSSPGSAFYLEKNATVKFLDSDGDMVWAKPGCVVTDSSSTGNVVVFCNQSTVTLNGPIVPYTCPSVTYDYSMVGGSACTGAATGMNDYSEIISVSVYPNPVISAFALSIDNSRNFDSCTFVLYNILGKEVKRIEDITQNKITLFRENLQS